MVMARTDPARAIHAKRRKQVLAQVMTVVCDIATVLTLISLILLVVTSWDHPRDQPIEVIFAFFGFGILTWLARTAADYLAAENRPSTE